MANSSCLGIAACVALGALGIPLPLAAGSSALPTALTLTPFPAGQTYYSGQAITYTATVGATSGNPTGTITFTLDNVAGTPVLVDSNHNASVVLNPLAGTHTVSAAYSGDQNFQASTSSTLNLTVNRAITSVLMASNPPQIAQPVAIRATVIVQAPGAGIPGGTVDFAVGTSPIAGCSQLPVQNGVAICNTNFSQVGSYSIGTIYSGDVYTAQSGGSLLLTVAKCAVGIYVAADPSNPANGAPVTLGALVIGATGVPAPTGTVTISDGNTALATLPLASDFSVHLVVPSGTLPPLPPGTHTIGAVYNGDANYGVSQALPVTVVMTGKPLTTTVVTAPAAQIGIPVKITAAVSSAGSATPGGTVDFANGSTPVAGCTGVALQNSAAVCGATFAQVGTITINASYAGDTYTAASKGSLQLAIGKGSPLVALGASPTSAAAGAAVTLNASVTGAPGVTAPSGTVAFTDGGAPLGTAALGVDGHASLVVPSGSVPALTPGTHTIGASYGGDSNYLAASAAAVSVAVSKAPTVVTLSSTPAQISQPVKITAAVSVSTAGGTVDFSAASGPLAGCTGLPLQNGAAVCNTSFPQTGTVTIGASYSGDTNLSPGTASLQLTVGKCSPGAYLASSPSSPAYGTVLTLGALVLGATGVPNPTGTVTFSDGPTTLATLTLGSDGRATLLAPSASAAALASGTHTITAVYNGDANYLSATAPTLAVTISKAATTLTLAVSPDSPTAGQAVNLIATSSPAGSGTVAFSNGANAIVGCIGVLSQNGTASCSTSFPQAGAFAITASYSGDLNTGPASTTIQLTVGQPPKLAPSNITLAYTPTAPVFGAPVTISTSVAPASSGPAPSGTVVFSDGTSPLGTAPLSASGQASLTAPAGTIAALAAGNHSITAVYSGDSSYANATSAPLALSIAKAPTTTTLTAANGGPFSATVTVPPPGAGTPTGLVQFSNGSTVIGTATLQPQGGSFVASLARNTQSGSITAAYLGDTNFAASTSAPVTPAKADVILTSNHNPSTPGQAVTFTVSVTNDAGPGTTPTGTVQLSADGTSIGTVSLAGGSASFSTAALAIGSHTVVANYVGDASFPAAAASLVQVVNQSTATLALTSNPTSSVFGQAVTFTAQWNSPSSGAAPTGQVQFSEGTASLGAASLSGGTAALTLSNLSPGTHAITAAWSGDVNWAPATSAPMSQVVGKAQTVTVLTIAASTLTAAVSVLSPGAGTPSGSVKFVNAASNAVLATASLTASSASIALPAITDPIIAVYSGDGCFLASTSDPATRLAVTNSASYSSLNVAPDEIVTLFGSSLGTATNYASPPADSLGGSTVSITDGAGVTRAAQIFYMSSAQASVLVPAGVAPGAGTLMVANPGQTPVATPLVIGSVAPGLFTANATGQGVAAAQVIRLHTDGTQDSPQNVAVFDTRQNVWVPVPIDLGSPTDTVFLLLYGTGIRHYAATPSCTIGSNPAGVIFAGPQGSFAGLDQVNVLLPQALRGSGTVSLQLTVDGIAANTVSLAFQ